LLHSATLLHDDVVDEGMERRGAVTARRLWGNGVSVLAGDLLLVCSLELTQNHGAELMPSLISTLRQLIEGEILQLRGRVELDVTEATYQRILLDKTASLFRWSAGTGARLAGASVDHQEKLAAFGEHLGGAFQLVDDVLDYSGEQTGKTLLADLAEGKLTLPLVLAVERRPQIAELLGRSHGGDREPVEQVGREVVASGACDEVRQRARRFTELAVTQLEDIGPSPARSLLVEVASELARRAQ
jgi:octaprenyl-diphosphate synthase